MYFWDFAQKNKISSFPFENQPITRTEFCSEGKYLALALGYDWAKGVEGIQSTKTKIMIYPMGEKDLK